MCRKSVCVHETSDATLEARAGHLADRFEIKRLREIERKLYPRVWKARGRLMWLSVGVMISAMILAWVIVPERSDTVSADWRTAIGLVGIGVFAALGLRLRWCASDLERQRTALCTLMVLAGITRAQRHPEELRQDEQTIRVNEE